jgi:hypothetical protein
VLPIGRTAIDRLAHAGAVPTTALAVTTELFRDWASPLRAPALDVIYWYFGEVPKHADTVGAASMGCGGDGRRRSPWRQQKLVVGTWAVGPRWRAATV